MWIPPIGWYHLKTNGGKVYWHCTQCLEKRQGENSGQVCVVKMENENAILMWAPEYANPAAENQLNLLRLSPDREEIKDLKGSGDHSGGGFGSTRGVCGDFHPGDVGVYE